MLKTTNKKTLKNERKIYTKMRKIIFPLNLISVIVGGWAQYLHPVSPAGPLQQGDILPSPRQSCKPQSILESHRVQ